MKKIVSLMTKNHNQNICNLKTTNILTQIMTKLLLSIQESKINHLSISNHILVLQNQNKINNKIPAPQKKDYHQKVSKKARLKHNFIKIREESASK